MLLSAAAIMHSAAATSLLIAPIVIVALSASYLVTFDRTREVRMKRIVVLIDGTWGKEGTGFDTNAEAVYKAAWKVVETCQAVQANYDYRIADEEEYKAEIERRRQIGLTIDPATAETTFWYADAFDPYHICDEKMHCGQVGRERFARHPGASWRDWVSFHDLPEATRNALWQRDGRKLVFPYGLNLEDDVINRPSVQKKNA